MIDTPFGRRFVFDAHTHFFGRSFFAGLAQQIQLSAAEDVASRLKWEIPDAAGPRWITEMDRHGVDRMISIHTLPGDMNEAASAIVGAQGRLVGYVMVNPLTPGALEQLRIAVTQLGFRGVALFPAMFRFAMTSDAAYEILQLANEHALNVFVHCGVLKIGFRTKLGLPCAFDASFSNPLQLQRPAAEFPRAKFIIPHLGSGLFRELLMLADQSPNVYSDTSGVGGWAKYLDGAPTPAGVLRQAVDVMGANRLLFGTDSTFFPRGWRRDIFEQQMKIYEEAKLTDEQVALILGENLRRLVNSD
jgi:predicted TIM-barrel fold metal-dependent hydrolase